MLYSLGVFRSLEAVDGEWRPVPGRGHDLRVVRQPDRALPAQGRRASTRRTSTWRPRRRRFGSIQRVSTSSDSGRPSRRRATRHGSIAPRRRAARPAPRSRSASGLDRGVSWKRRRPCWAAPSAPGRTLPTTMRRRHPEASYQERHLADTRRRLIVAAILTVPLLGGLAAMTVAPFLPAFLTNPWLQLALATPVQVYAGWPFYKGAWNVLAPRRDRHEHADRRRNVRRLPLQPRRDPVPRLLPRGRRGDGGPARRSTSTPRP